MAVIPARFSGGTTLSDDGTTLQGDESVNLGIEFHQSDDDTVYHPAVVGEVELENAPGQSFRADQCGNASRTKTVNSGWQIRITGIITANEDRENNLSLPVIKSRLARAEEITLYSDVHSGQIIVSNVVITDDSTLVYVNTPDTWDRERAFRFQLQLGETETSSE